VIEQSGDQGEDPTGYAIVLAESDWQAAK